MTPRRHQPLREDSTARRILVAILDADKEGYLRSETSLIQTCGRAARNLNGRVIMYADTMIGAMKRAIDEMNRRRKETTAYNKSTGSRPGPFRRRCRTSSALFVKRIIDRGQGGRNPDVYMSDGDFTKMIARLRRQMKEAASKLDLNRCRLA